MRARLYQAPALNFMMLYMFALSSMLHAKFPSVIYEQYSAATCPNNSLIHSQPCRWRAWHWL